jgi:hypothetical protein
MMYIIAILMTGALTCWGVVTFQTCSWLLGFDVNKQVLFSSLFLFLVCVLCLFMIGVYSIWGLAINASLPSL